MSVETTRPVARLELDIKDLEKNIKDLELKVSRFDLDLMSLEQDLEIPAKLVAKLKALDQTLVTLADPFFCRKK